MIGTATRSLAWVAPLLGLATALVLGNRSSVCPPLVLFRRKRRMRAVRMRATNLGGNGAGFKVPGLKN